jgi:O-antigen/teichoic acid export membrane protein
MTAQRTLGGRLAGNATLSALAQVVLALLGLAWIPCVTTEMGEARLGLLVLLTTYVEGFTLLAVSLNTMLVKLLAEHLPHDRATAQSYFWSAVAIVVTVGILVVAGTAMGAEAIAVRLADTEPMLQAETAQAVVLAAVSFFVRLVAQALATVPMALQRYGMVSAVTVVVEVARVALSILAVMAGARLPGVFAISVATSWLGLLAYAHVSSTMAPGLLRRPTFSRNSLRRLCHLSMFVAVGNVSARLVHTADLTILSLVGTPAGIAFYAIPYSIGQRLWSVLSGLASVTLPAASTLSAAGDTSRVAALYLRASKLVAAAAVIPGVTLMVLGPRLLGYWLGERWQHSGGLVLRVLVLGFIINALGHIPYQLLQAVGRVRLTARVAIVYAVCNVTCFALLIPPYGAIGAGLAFLLSQLVVVPWFIITTTHTLGADAASLATVLRRVLVVAVAGLGATILLGARSTSLAWTLTAAVIAPAVHVLLTFRYVLDDAERAATRELARGVWRTVAGFRRPGEAALQA